MSQLSVEQAANVIGICSSLVRRYLRQKRIRCTWVGGTRVLRESDVLKFAEKPRKRGPKKKR